MRYYRVFMGNDFREKVITPDRFEGPALPCDALRKAWTLATE